MAIVDEHGNRCDRALRIHFVKVHRIEFDILAHIRFTQQLFGKYGIALQLTSARSVHMDKRSHARLAILETQCEGGDEPEMLEIYSRFGVQDLSSVTAFLVHEIVDPKGRPDEPEIVGCAAHLPYRPAIFMARDIGPTTIAHELGHVLMESAEHSDRPNDVMLAEEPSFSPRDPRFNVTQLLRMRRSPLLRPC